MSHEVTEIMNNGLLLKILRHIFHDITGYPNQGG